MKVAVISLSEAGAGAAEILRKGLPEADVYLHETVRRDAARDGIKARAIKEARFASLLDLTRRLFRRYRGLVYIAPCGAVVRALAPNVRDKRKDPAVVVVDAGGRFAVSLLSGHEGGANELAVTAANLLGAEPVVTTASESLKDVIVGVGCRQGTGADRIVAAVAEALEKAAVPISRVRLLASADVKAHEEGLAAAARRLRIPLRLVPSEDIRAAARDFGRSEFVRGKIGLPAVAEPAALLAGRRTRLLLPKTVCGGVTVAVAKENCTSSG